MRLCRNENEYRWTWQSFQCSSSHEISAFSPSPRVTERFNITKEGNLGILVMQFICIVCEYVPTKWVISHSKRACVWSSNKETTYFAGAIQNRSSLLSSTFGGTKLTVSFHRFDWQADCWDMRKWFWNCVLTVCFIPHRFPKEISELDLGTAESIHAYVYVFWENLCRQFWCEIYHDAHVVMSRIKRLSYAPPFLDLTLIFKVVRRSSSVWVHCLEIGDLFGIFCFLMFIQPFFNSIFL